MKKNSLKQIVDMIIFIVLLVNLTISNDCPIFQDLPLTDRLFTSINSQLIIDNIALTGTWNSLQGQEVIFTILALNEQENMVKLIRIEYSKTTQISIPLLDSKANIVIYQDKSATLDTYKLSIWFIDQPGFTFKLRALQQNSNVLITVSVQFDQILTLDDSCDYFCSQNLESVFNNDIQIQQAKCIEKTYSSLPFQCDSFILDPNFQIIQGNIVFGFQSSTWSVSSNGQSSILKVSEWSQVQSENQLYLLYLTSNHRFSIEIIDNQGMDYQVVYLQNQKYKDPYSYSILFKPTASFIIIKLIAKQIQLYQIKFKLYDKSISESQVLCAQTCSSTFAAEYNQHGQFIKFICGQKAGETEPIKGCFTQTNPTQLFNFRIHLNPNNFISESTANTAVWNMKQGDKGSLIIYNDQPSSSKVLMLHFYSSNAIKIIQKTQLLISQSIFSDNLYQFYVVFKDNLNSLTLDLIALEDAYTSLQIHFYEFNALQSGVCQSTCEKDLWPTLNIQSKILENVVCSDNYIVSSETCLQLLKHCTKCRILNADSQLICDSCQNKYGILRGKCVGCPTPHCQKCQIKVFMLYGRIPTRFQKSFVCTQCQDQYKLQSIKKSQYFICHRS